MRRNRNTNPSYVKTEIVDIVHGLVTAPPDGQASLVVGGKSIAVAALIVELQGYAAAYQAVDDLESKMRTAMVERDALAFQAIQRKQAAYAAIKGALGPLNPALEQYGIAPNKVPRALTTDEQQARIAKARATRVARHTMGKRQRLAITGATPVAPTKAG